MPGSSLWLIPPAQSKLTPILTSLITDTVPAHLNVEAPRFTPHVTLTSELPDNIEDPEAFLKSLDLPYADNVKVRFEGLDVEEPFFRKCNIRVAKDGVKELATICRTKVEGDRTKAEEWAESEYRPHESLLYADIEIPDDKKAEIEKVVKDTGIGFNGEGTYPGWNGGSVWLVATGTNQIEQWKPIAERKLAADIKKSYATCGS